jgi:hypothetical protein
MKMAEKMDMVARFCLLKDDEFLILKSTAYDRIFTKTHSQLTIII